MKIIKDESEIVAKVRKTAHLSAQKALIVSRPDRAEFYLSKSRKKVAQIDQTYQTLIKQVKLFKHLTHEVENLLDNYYIISGAVNEVLNSDVKKSFRKLVLVERSNKVFEPRVNVILSDMLKVSNYVVNRNILYEFLSVYQSKTSLSIRELSFVSYALRVILIEKINDIMSQSILSLAEFKDADFWFKEIVKEGEKNLKSNYTKLTSNLTSRYGVIPANLVFHLLQKLSQYGPDTRPVVKWLKLNLLKQGININDLAELENKRQTAISIQISNVIDSLRWINQFRFDDFIVEVNMVDTILGKDPAKVYLTMDAGSQNVYRNEVIKIGDQAGVHELEVAKLAIRLCQNEKHVGHFLVGPGRLELEKKINYKRLVSERIKAFSLKWATLLYLGGILSFNLIFTGILIWLFPALVSQTITASILLILAFILNSDISINFVNLLVSIFIPVRPLFRLDLSSGLSTEQATFVVVPSMLRESKATEELLKRLEINYLGNVQNNIYYALLMSFKDSKTETNSNDEFLVQQMQKGIDALNQKYSPNKNKFFLFHRKRVWNPQESVFMGWERKRGKLHEFNLLLRGNTETTFIEELPAYLLPIKYILTIDEDTRLPKDSAIKLIGCIDHPLNQPVVDTKAGRVVSGYGIVQPHMTTKFQTARATSFSKLFSSAMGIDSYTGPVADLYQDLLGNSLFYGKGIYDIDAMEAVVGDRLPENQILSHDLLEGLHTRVGFATDIFLFEGFPESYKEYSLRTHRWIRGDWQIAEFLGSKILSLMDKWKIFDNLRRSLLPVFLVLFLIVSYLAYPNLYGLSLLYILLVIGSSYIIGYLFRLLDWPKEMTLAMKIDHIFKELDSFIIQIIYRFVFLLDQALISLRAVTVSLFRLLISHKNLLLWQNSHEVAKNLKGTQREFLYFMFPTIFTSGLCLLWFMNREHNFYFYTTIILWLLSPFVAYQLSRIKKVHQYKSKDLTFLRNIACRSGRFFLEFSNREANHLIPDHYQEEPVTNSPAATSPTNIGMHLLSNLSAYDFGHLSFSDLHNRLLDSFRSLDSMARFKGHFYNWYDIRTLQVLHPAYVSSVDSANLLLALLTLKQGLLDIIDKPMVGLTSLKGLADILRVMIEDLNSIIKSNSVSKPERRLLRGLVQDVQTLLISLRVEEGEIVSIESFSKIFNLLSEGNEKIKKVVSRLSLGQDRGLLSSIYSSVDHLNILLRQQMSELNFFMVFYQARRTQPVIRNTEGDNKLTKTFNLLLDKLNFAPSLNYLTGPFRQEVLDLDFLSLVHSANLEQKEKEKIENWYDQVLDNVSLAESRAIKTRGELLYSVSLCEKFFMEADFSFLYNKERGLFHIGYNVTFDKIDNSYYDFLASEANSISFVSIIKNDVPLKHWFYLGRKLVRLDYKTVVLSSWGGSLFEYLTSHIFYKVHKESLLGQAAHISIKSHIKYGQNFNIPWGMGESAYTALDLNNNYQYQIFGHPSLGFRRDLKDFLVVAPYTTVMSLAFKPKQALLNLKRLAKLKLLGRYGFYDAIDYNTRLKNKNTLSGKPAKIYYAHHQGFALQALNNEVNQDRIRSLFMSDPRVQMLDTLLEERVPSSMPARPIENLERLPVEYLSRDSEIETARQFIPLNTSYPRRAFISNGTYTVNISNAGAGGSRVSGINLNRFREDPIVEPWGQFIYLSDFRKDHHWSPTTEPLGLSQGKNKIEYYENKAHFTKIFNEIESSLLVSVAPTDNVEFRSLTLTNQGKDKKEISITSYGEVSLSKVSDDLHHPSFEKLFVKSEYLPKYKALIYTRHNKDKRQQKIYFAHRFFTNQSSKIPPFYTTARSEILGRGGSIRQPAILDKVDHKTESITGYNFDQVFCFQNKLLIEPNQTANITYVNIFANTREDLIAQLKKYDNERTVQNTIKKADKQSGDIIRSLGISPEQALQYQGLASRLLSSHYPSRPKEYTVDSPAPAVETLWRLSISGDRPIWVVKFYDLTDLPLVKNVILTHQYLKYKGVAHDLVLLNEYPASYLKSFEDEVDFLIRYNQTPADKFKPGSIFHLRSSHLEVADKNNLLALAKIVFDSQVGTLDQQISALLQSAPRTPIVTLKPIKKISASQRDLAPKLSNLKFYNDLGGFDEENLEYVLNINYKKGLITPKPWANIISNSDIGFVMTESGSMYTWLFDSYDNRLTKRLDDPLSDRSSEVFYIRDEETGEFWNPTPLPILSGHTYTTRHGLGYSSISHTRRGVEHTLLAYVPVDDLVKVVQLKLKNTSKLSKKLSLTGYFEMTVGGAHRDHTKDYLESVIDSKTGAVLVKNIFGSSFKDIVSFVDFNAGDCLITNDREEFLGKNGDIGNPAGLKREKLSNILYKDIDHCIAQQSFFNLDAGEEKEITILIGGGTDLNNIQDLIKKYRKTETITKTFNEVKKVWQDRLTPIQIKTPDESLNTLFNSRLLYQLISSRLLGRTGYYQPSGAYGFRDQLQDSMALVWSQPDWTKEIILKAARHQFVEGDVQNWWHEHNSFGVRTTFSDHQLWLPYVTTFYLDATTDASILNEKSPYLKAPLLDFVNNPNWAGVPEVLSEEFDLYDHCLRAIERTFNFGKNGLPIIGHGDWNDGLSLVGERGIGESVWLGWFLSHVLEKFIPIIKDRGDIDRVQKYELTLRNLKKALEHKAWDGRWYKRAFFDTGVALGSRSNREFKIDSVAQSWSVLSGNARPERAKMAMESLRKHLQQENNLWPLLSPALDKSLMDPGYIKDYPAGVRENGAQYSHAALWAAQAFTKLKDADSAMKIIDSVNPIKRSSSKDAVNLYQVEPYAVASDIYAKPSEAGRGGWTWYTGSAGVMYRAIWENILGIKIKGNQMEIDPCIPKDWPGFEFTYTYKKTKYNIKVTNNSSLLERILSKQIIELVDDGKKHEIEIKL